MTKRVFRWALAGRQHIRRATSPPGGFRSAGKKPSKLLAGAAILLLAAAAGARWLPADAQGIPGFVVIPDSSVEHAGDKGLRAHTNHLIFVRPQFTSTSPSGEQPDTIRPVYGLASTGGKGIIAIVDAFHYPTALKDFNVFASRFGLPPETSTNALADSNAVFQVVYASGSQPRTDGGWAQEAALDIEWAHAMAPGAKIVLVEAASNSFNDLLAAVDKASQIYGVQEVSMSWGGSEFSSEVNYDSHFPQNGIIYFAASGDTGGKTIWPGTSPLVVSSGGTSINRTPATPSGTFTGETGWSGSGGGPSSYEPRPSYQSTAGHASVTKRLAPDFSFDADPNTGVSVYDSTKYQGVSGWLVFGGTSVAAPALAGIVNLAHDGATVSGTLSELQSIYDNMAGGYFRDILTGKAGSYNCESGWDYVTGVGSNLGPGGK